MVDYRCYFLSRGNSFIAVDVVRSDTDSGAIVQASMLAANHPECAGFELWQGRRHVHKHISSPLHRRADHPAAGKAPATSDDPLAAMRALSARCRGSGTVVPMTLSEARRIRNATTRASRNDRGTF